MQVLRKAMLLAIVPALILMAYTGALAVPIRTLPDLQTVTIYEATFGTAPTSYSPNAPQLTTRLADPLTDANSDFSFFSQEDYDVFYSNADGTANSDGSFLTVEGVWLATPPFGGGSGNIAEVELTFGGVNPGSRFGDFVQSFAFGSICDASTCILSSVALAADGSLGTFPRLGHTSQQNLADRFRLTIGFDDISDVASPVPEPATWALLAAGLAGLLWLRRKPM